MVESQVLVLNQNYQPLNICRAKRAVILILEGKAEIVERDTREIRSPSVSIPLPSVIRLNYMVRPPRMKRKLSRREIFVRDRYTCQYCGRRTKDLTLDHVIPRHLGGKNDWTNIVSACKECNQKKAGRTPKEAGMTLIRKPTKPPPTPFFFSFDFFSKPEWQKYLF